MVCLIIFVSAAPPPRPSSGAARCRECRAILGFSKKVGRAAGKSKPVALWLPEIAVVAAVEGERGIAELR
jgi:hypothetical protein